MSGCRFYDLRRCCAILPIFGECGVQGRWHGLAVSGGLHWLCAPHATQSRPRDLAAAHPATHVCRHPDSRWHDHGCEIPTVEDVRVPEHEGASV